MFEKLKCKFIFENYYKFNLGREFNTILNFKWYSFLCIKNGCKFLFRSSGHYFSPVCIIFENVQQFIISKKVNPLEELDRKKINWFVIF